jgi:hypothetical protein
VNSCQINDGPRFGPSDPQQAAFLAIAPIPPHKPESATEKLVS